MSKRERLLERVLNLEGALNQAIFYEDLEVVKTRIKWLMSEIEDYENNTGDYEDFKE